MEKIYVLEDEESKETKITYINVDKAIHKCNFIVFIKVKQISMEHCIHSIVADVIVTDGLSIKMDQIIFSDILLTEV